MLLPGQATRASHGKAGTNFMATLDSLAAPPDVQARLRQLCEELSRAVGPKLAAVVLYGGVARGRYRPGASDINILIILNEASAETLSAIAGPLRAAWRAVRVEPMVLTQEEVDRVAAVFPTKILDIQERRIVLHGQDPLAEVVIDKQHLRLRTEQELRNLALRLRRRYLAAYDDPTDLALALRRVARGLAVQFSMLLRLAGKPIPAEDRTADIYSASATAFGLDADALARLAALRQSTESDGGDVAAWYNRILATVGRAADYAGQMKVA
jgi:predicted nucleotidyltransferase